MVVGAAGDDVEATLDEHAGHGLGVLDHLLLVGLELGLQGFLEAHRLAGDDVHQRAALGTGEDRRVELLLDGFVGLGQDQAATRTAQGLVGSAGDHVGEGDRVGVDPGGDQAGEVGHVDEQVGTHGIGDGAEAGEVQHLGVGGVAGDDDLGLVFLGQALDLGVVDQALLVDAVLHGVVQLAGRGHGGAVGQVTAVSQAHAEDGVTGFDQREVDGRVGLGAGVRLDVGVVGAEQLLGAVDGQLLDHVDVFAAAIVALVGIAFGVLVGQHAALGFHDRRAGVVFRSDQLDVIFLTLGFLLHGGIQVGVEAGEGGFTAEHGGRVP